MKKLSIILCALALIGLTVWAQARTTVVVVGGTPAAAASPTLKDSNTAASAGVYQVGRYSTSVYVGGNFTAGSNYTLTSVKLYLHRVGDATGTLVAHIYATSAGAPTGSPIATSSSINRSTLATSETATEFTGFSQALTSGTEYCVIAAANTTNGDEDVRIHYSSGGGTYTHETYLDGDGTPPFSANNDEYIKFETYGN